MEVGDIFEYDWVVRNASPARTSRAMPVRLGLLASRQNELPTTDSDLYRLISDFGHLISVL